MFVKSFLDDELCPSAERRLQEQFESLAEAEWRSLYRAAIRVGFDGQAAELVVREALLRAYQSLVKISEAQRSRLKVLSWLRSLAEDVAQERLKSVAAPEPPASVDRKVPAGRDQRRLSFEGSGSR